MMKSDLETADLARYFADEGILIYDKELTRDFISQMLRNPIYAQADLDMYEFFKSQGTMVINEAADFAGTSGYYLYQGRDVQERKNKHLRPDPCGGPQRGAGIGGCVAPLSEKADGKHYIPEWA